MEKSLSVVVEVTKSLSRIVKSNFVSFTDQKKEIKIIANNDPKVLKSSIKAVEYVEDVHRDDMPDLHGDLEVLKEKITDEAYDKGLELGQQKGYEEGYQKGYEEGKVMSQDEGQRLLETERDALYEEIEHLRSEINKQFEVQKKELEPKMLYIIEALVTKLIGVQSVSQDTIMYLIKSGMNELDLHGDLVIKVSSFDVDQVLEHKARIVEGLSEKIDVEILVDQQLDKNECIIETNMGSIDCSLGTQMESLLQELRLIRESLEGDGFNA